MRFSALSRGVALCSTIMLAVACTDATPVQPRELEVNHDLGSTAALILGTVTVSPASASLVVGATTQFSAKVVDRKRVSVTNATITWISDKPSVATVSSKGLVTAVSAGSANIRAFSGLIWDATPVTVTPPVVVVPTPTAPTPTPPVTPTTPAPPTTPVPPVTPTPTTPTPTTPTAPEGDSWTFCTNAGSMCDFIGLRDVRLGPVNGPYVTLTAIRSIPCAAYGFNNQNPAPNKALHCDYGPVKTTTLTNPMPGMSGFNPSTVTVPLGGPGLGSAQTQSAGYPANSSDGSGAFRLTCSLTKFDFVDPIVYPGQQNASHLHMFFGNAALTAFTTSQSLASTGNSTCLGGTLNRSAYWVPAVFDSRTAEVIVPAEGVFYYKTGYGIDPKVVVAPPAGLRMIAGNKSATAAQDYVEWSCRDRYLQNTGLIPTTCPIGDAVRIAIQFPQCWDGKNLDSPDHKSHMAYPIYRNPPEVSTCPTTHPITLPAISEHFDFPVTATSAPAYWRLTSDMYSNSIRGGYSLHADWMNGWDPATIQTIVTQCLNKGKDCQVGLLGNGQTLY